MPEVPDTVDDAIEPLSSPSTDEVFEATRPFSAREIASAAASEALSGGGGAAFHGALYYTEDHSLAGDIAPHQYVVWENVIYDTDAFLQDPVSPPGVAQSLFKIPPGLGGIYLLEAILYVANDQVVADPTTFYAVGLITEDASNCDFNLKQQTLEYSTNAGFWLSGSGAFVRPLEDGENFGLFVSLSTAPMSVLGGTNRTMISMTRLGDLPAGYESPF